MAADAGIFQQYLNPARSVADYRGDMDKQEQNALTLASARLANQQAQQDMADTQAVRQAYMQSGGDQNKLMQLLQSGGQYKSAQALQKSQLESQKTQGEIDLSKAHAGNFQAQTAKTNEEAKFAAAIHHAQGLAYVKTPQDVISYFDQGIAKGIFPADQRQQMIQQAGSYPTLDAWKKAESDAAIPVLERFKEDANNSRNAATNATSRANNAATVAQQEQTSLRADRRAREATAAVVGKPFEVTGKDGDPVLVQQDKQGNIKPVTGYGTKNSVAKPTERQQKAIDANEAIALLNQAEPLLKSATGSYGGKGIDILSQAFGVATPGSISAQQLKAIEGALVAKMPKMSGPQSDKDVLLYRQMAAQIGDDTVPYARKTAAMDTVREIQERYAGLAKGSSKPTQNPTKPGKPKAPAGTTVSNW